MPRKKPYDDGCAAAHALDLIGERWALLIVRELIPGPKRFTDLKASLPGVSTNILTTRLAELEAGSVIARKTLPPPGAAQIYALTDWGADLEPLIKDLGRWAARSPTLIPGKPMSAAALMLSLRAMFSPEKASFTRARLSLVLNGVAHRAIVERGALDIEIGDIEDPDVAVAGDPNLLAGVIYGGMSISDAEAAGLEIDGRRSALRRFCRLFPLPDPAPDTAAAHAS